MTDTYHARLGSIDRSNRSLARIIREALQLPTLQPLIPGTYQLMVDTWEGQGLLDVAALKAGGVAGAFIRINSMAGGHHRDTLFEQQWAAMEGMVRVPYFVYNPWVSGQKNFDVLASYMPASAKAVALDVEVKKDGYSPTTYAQQFSLFDTLAKKYWNCVTYTAEWALPFLASWPKDDLYWWAQYPSSLYKSMTITWDKMRELLLPYDKPFNAAKVPGTLKGWQCSGDRIVLPGSARVIDVNVMYMSLSELQTFAGVKVVEPPPPDPEPGDPDMINAIRYLADKTLEGAKLQAAASEKIALAISGLDVVVPPPDPDPDPDPDPVDELLGYKGTDKGVYETIDDGNPVKFIGMTDSYGRDTSQINGATVTWLRENRPDDWAWFVANETFTQNEAGLWFTKLRIYRGQKVRIGAFGMTDGEQTGRVIGFMLDAQDTSVAVPNPEFVDWLFNKIQGQPVYFPQIHPWRQPKDTVPCAIWVPMKYLRKVG